MSAPDHLLSEDDGERGERQPTGPEEVDAAAARTDRLQSHQTKAGDAQGLRGVPRDEDIGGQADVVHGESGDSG